MWRQHLVVANCQHQDIRVGGVAGGRHSRAWQSQFLESNDCVSHGKSEGKANGNYPFCANTSSTHEKVFIMVGKPSVVVPNKTT